MNAVLSTPRLTGSVLATLAAACVGAALGRYAEAIAPVYEAARDRAGAPAGLRIAGEPLAPGETIRAAVVRHARAIEHAPVELVVAGAATKSVIHTTYGELGVQVPVESLVRRAERLGHHDGFGVRARERLMAARGELDVPVAIELDVGAMLRVLLPFKENEDRRAIPARYDFANSRVIPDRAGWLLDVDAAAEAVRAAARKPESIVRLPILSRTATVTADALAHLSTHEVVSEFETAFAYTGADAPRGKNIQNAASKLDGVVLPPHEVVSFNAIVGPRTVDNGFQHAFQIYKGEMVEGVGGGTCQVSSTLHAAAVFAGLEVVERAPHSRPLGYIPLGLDSTVVYPEVDLKLRNPWNFPLLVHATVDAGRIRVQLLGERRAAQVTVSRETLKVWPFWRKIELHPELPKGRFVRKEKGIRGYDIKVIRRTVRSDGESTVETSIDKYPPTPELYWVAPDLDTDQALPPLPEGADPERSSGGSSPIRDANRAHG
jgi:vancomycin resistance protein YoaR